MKFLFWLSPQLLFKTISVCKKNGTRCDQTCTAGFVWSAACFGHVLVNLEFFRQIFEKYSNIKFHENPSSGSVLEWYRYTNLLSVIVIIISFIRWIAIFVRCFIIFIVIIIFIHPLLIILIILSIKILISVIVIVASFIIIIFNLTLST